MDFNQDGVIRPFIFETQHSSSSGEEENAVDEGTQGKIKRETSSSGEESDNDSILDMDFNQDGVIRPFIFETQHSSSSGEEENAVDEGTRRKMKGETSTR